jgi:HAMP domain-containing protein
MKSTTTAGGTGRLARRLFVLFVLVAVVPLALTDWLASLATTEVAAQLTQDHRRTTTRHTSRQVLDRLLAGKALISALVESSDQDHPTGLGRVFSQVVRVDGDAPRSWPAKQGEELLLAWGQARSGLGRAGPPAGPLEAELRVDYSLPTQPRVLLGAYRHGKLVWVAVLDGGYLWAPLADSGMDSAWWVRDGEGRMITLYAGEDYTLRLEGGLDAVEVFETTAELFLAGELHAGEWSFTQRAPRVPVLWNGAPLALWLAAVAVAALLAIATLSHWRIRRTLEPLAQLTRVTRRLAAGTGRARVEILRDDEIG